MNLSSTQYFTRVAAAIAHVNDHAAAKRHRSVEKARATAARAAGAPFKPAAPPPTRFQTFVNEYERVIGCVPGALALSPVTAAVKLTEREHALDRAAKRADPVFKVKALAKLRETRAKAARADKADTDGGAGVYLGDGGGAQAFRDQHRQTASTTTAKRSGGGGSGYLASGAGTAAQQKAALMEEGDALLAQHGGPKSQVFDAVPEAHHTTRGSGSSRTRHFYKKTWPGKVSELEAVIVSLRAASAAATPAAPATPATPATPAATPDPGPVRAGEADDATAMES